MAVPSNHRSRSPSGHPHPQGPEAPPSSALRSPRPVLPRTPASPASTQFLESSRCFQPPDCASSFHPSNGREKHVLFHVSSSTAFSSVPSPPCQQDHGAEVLTGVTHHGPSSPSTRSRPGLCEHTADTCSPAPVPHTRHLSILRCGPVCSPATSPTWPKSLHRQGHLCSRHRAGVQTPGGSFF